MERDMFCGGIEDRLRSSWSDMSVTEMLRIEREYLQEHRKRGVIFQIEGSLITMTCRWMKEKIKACEAAGEEMVEPREFLAVFKSEARKMFRQLKTLERQVKNNWTWVEVNNPETGRHRLPVVELSIDGADTEATPVFFIGGIASDIEGNLLLPIAIALLQKRRVFVMTYPEQEVVENPEDWKAKLEKEKSFRLHAILAEEIIDALGLSEIDLFGNSMGGGVAIELASRLEPGRIQKLVAMEPMGFQHKSWVEIGVNYYVQQGLKVMIDPEKRAKILWHQRRRGGKVKKGLFNSDANILRQRQFDLEKLARIMPRERYQVWLGDSSPLLSEERVRRAIMGAEEERWRQGGVPVEIYRVLNDDHTFPVVRSMGVVSFLERERPVLQVNNVSQQKLQNSVALDLLQRVGQELARRARVDGGGRIEE